MREQCTYCGRGMSSASNKRQTSSYSLPFLVANHDQIIRRLFEQKVCQVGPRSALIMHMIPLISRVRKERVAKNLTVRWGDKSNSLMPTRAGIDCSVITQQ